MYLERIAIGTWTWGNERLGYNQYFNESDIEKIIFNANKMGITCYDTAIGYKGSPKLIGKYVSQLEDKENVKIMTKIMPYFWRYTDSQLEKIIHNHLIDLNQEHIFLLQLHRPFPPIPSFYWIKKLYRLKEKGLIKHIGVSNFSYQQLEKLNEMLKTEGIDIFSNQILFNLLKRQIELEGQLKQEKIKMFAYSPLANGLLADSTFSKKQFEEDFSRYRLLKNNLSMKHVEQVSILIELLEKYKEKHRLQSIATLSLQWILQKKAIPIVGISQMKHLLSLKELEMYSLSESEMHHLDNISAFWTNEY